MAAEAFLAAMLLAGSAPSPAGHYRLHVHEAASELILRANGRFEYGLAYGALDEEATGRWRRVGNHILLTTIPKPVPASFAPSKAERTTRAPLALNVTWPNGRGIPGINFRI